MFGAALPNRRAGAFALACWLALGVPAAACPDDFPIEAVVAGVDERLELTLEDGRRLVLAGVAAAKDSHLAAEARARLADWLSGLPVSFRPLATEADRWGRLPVRMVADAPLAEPDAPRLDVAAALVEAGLARFRPSLLLGACRHALLAAEARARLEGVGLWRDPAHAIVSARDRAALAAAAGGELIVEGRVTRVGEARFRTYLNFGPIRGQDFSVTILKRNRARFDKIGVSLPSLAGRRIRVRGVLETRFGPQIEIASPAEMEILDAPGAASAGSGDDAAK